MDVKLTLIFFDTGIHMPQVFRCQNADAF